MEQRREAQSWCLPVAEIEAALDKAIAGLSRMDAELLVQLACCCLNWDADVAAAMPMESRSRLSWKLLVLGRLLQQTRTNLNVIGLAGRDGGPESRYRAIMGH